MLPSASSFFPPVLIILCPIHSQCLENALTGQVLFRYNCLRSPLVLVSSLTGRTSILPT
jgi:hypothetical protein